MTTISVRNLSQAENLQRGYVNLIGSTGIHYDNLALYIPNYGWVPCSKKLQKNFLPPLKILHLLCRIKKINIYLSPHLFG